MGLTWGPPGSCRPQMGPMLAPWTWLSGWWPQSMTTDIRNSLWCTSTGDWGGSYEANFLRSVIFPNFPNDENSGYLNDIKLIFGRCHRSWAAETPGKYEHDWKYLTYNFAKSKFPVTEKLTNGALVTPTPGEGGQYRAHYHNPSTERYITACAGCHGRQISSQMRYRGCNKWFLWWCVRFITDELFHLTHWGRNEMNNISQTTFSNVFSSMKMYEFRLTFHWILFQVVQLTIFQHWFR